jgi:hypothetical protein
MLRTPLKRRRSKPRKGRTRDLAYMAWCAKQPCLVSGRFGVTLHHVRSFGSGRDDRRVVPLMAEFHLIQHGKLSIEGLGKQEFERRFEIDLEAEIIRLNALFEELPDKTKT